MRSMRGGFIVANVEQSIRITTPDIARLICHHAEVAMWCSLSVMPRRKTSWCLDSILARFVPDSVKDCLPFPVCGNTPQPLNLPLPTISLCITNHVSVLHVFCNNCFLIDCSRMLFVHLYSTCVLFLFWFTYAFGPSVFIPMCLPCILGPYN